MPDMLEQNWLHIDLNEVWARGCDEAEISQEKRLFTLDILKPL